MTVSTVTKKACWIVDLTLPMLKLRQYIYSEIVPEVIPNSLPPDALAASVDRLAASMTIYSGVLVVNGLINAKSALCAGEMTLHPMSLLTEDLPLLNAAAAPKLAEGLAIHSEVVTLEQIYERIPNLDNDQQIKVTSFQAILGDTPALMINGDEYGSSAV